MQQQSAIPQLVQAQDGLFVNLAAWQPAATTEWYLQDMALMWHEQQMAWAWEQQQQSMGVNTDPDSGSPLHAPSAISPTGSSTGDSQDPVQGYAGMQHQFSSRAGAKKGRGPRSRASGPSKVFQPPPPPSRPIDLSEEAFPALGGSVAAKAPVQTPKWGKVPTGKVLRPTATEWSPGVAPISTGGSGSEAAAAAASAWASPVHPTTPQLRPDAPAWGNA
jgi:hypothetical protein